VGLRADKRAYEVATIGYQATTVADFLETLTEAGIELVADIRAVAASRRPGFAKTRLAENLGGVGIDYVHLRGLGTPADGRAAIKKGRFAEMREIYAESLASTAAQQDLETLIELIQTGRRVCLLCFEADPTNCHRSLAAAALSDRIRIEVDHLRPEPDIA
jgi:uncharacterized protein (DUF488 family)